MKINKFILFLLFLFSFSTVVFAQNDVRVRASERAKEHFRSAPNDDCGDNYSSKGNTNPHTGKAGTINCPTVAVKHETGAYGTGEYLLVPAIVRNDPAGTAGRFNTCGAAIIAIMDRGDYGGLTDPQKQAIYPEVMMTIAESRFRKATEFDAENYVYHTNLALILFRQNKDEEALKSILKAIELNPKDEKLREFEALIRREKTTVIILDDVKNN